VDEFVGAQPPAQVERFFDGLVPSEADALVEAGDEAALRHALELDSGRADAAVPLARLLLGRGEVDEALKLVEPIVGDFGAEGLAARIRLEQDADSDLREAFTALDAGDIERGLDKLLEAVAASTDGTRDDLRRAIVGVLDELGAEDPRAREYRRRLATALY
jgi:putative thioredoxin